MLQKHTLSLRMAVRIYLPDEVKLTNGRVAIGGDGNTGHEGEVILIIAAYLCL